MIDHDLNAALRYSSNKTEILPLSVGCFLFLSRFTILFLLPIKTGTDFAGLLFTVNVLSVNSALPADVSH